MISQETCFTMSRFIKTQQTNSFLKASKGLVSGCLCGLEHTEFCLLGT